MLQRSILSRLPHRSNDSTLSIISEDENDTHAIATEDNIVTTKYENEEHLVHVIAENIINIAPLEQ